MLWLMQLGQTALSVQTFCYLILFSTQHLCKASPPHAQRHNDVHFRKIVCRHSVDTPIPNDYLHNIYYSAASLTLSSQHQV